MRRLAVAAAALVGVAWLAGCKLERQAIPATQLVVDVDAEAALRPQLAALELSVESSDQRDHLDARKPVFDQRLELTGGDADAAPQWPIRLVLTPRADDARRVFVLSARAFDAGGEQVVEARLATGYIGSQIRYVRLWLTTACQGVQCSELETCDAMICGDAWRDPAELPFLPGPDAGLDGGPDAGPDAGDGAVPPDAGDGGPSDSGAEPPIDSGPPIDPCLTDNGGCDPVASCENLDGAARCGACPTGYVDVNRDGTRCDDLDECQADNGGCDREHGTCVNTQGGRDCMCQPGYNGNGRACSLNVPCSQSANVCDLRASCLDVEGRQLCVCNDGFEGDGGQCVDIDECERNLDDCVLNAACTNTPGSFSCACNKGYRDVTGACVDIDDCAENTDDCDGDPDACVNISGGFMCRCPAGYAGSGVGDTCQEIDECALDRDNCDDTPNACLNLPGSYRCMCPMGYTGLGVGNGGCSDIDECTSLTLPHNCDTSPAACMNLVGSFRCQCPAGYAGTGAGAGGCVEQNECMLGTDTCDDDPDACINDTGGEPGYHCACPPGYDGTGVSATGCTDRIQCGASDTCNRTTQNCVEQLGEPGFTCECSAGYMMQGNACVNIDGCNPNLCPANSTCMDAAPGGGPAFTCTCQPGFMMMGNACVNIDDCNPNPCPANSTCMEAAPGSSPAFTCMCGPGLMLTNGVCVNVDECASSPPPCGANSTCVERTPFSAPGYDCNCNCGYTLSMSNSCVPDLAGPMIGGDPSFTTSPAPAFTAANHIIAFQVQVPPPGTSLRGFGAVPLPPNADNPMFRMALYSDANGAPGTLVEQSEPVLLLSSSRIPVADASATCRLLPMGTYWLAILANGTFSIGTDTMNAMVSPVIAPPPPMFEFGPFPPTFVPMPTIGPAMNIYIIVTAPN